MVLEATVPTTKVCATCGNRFPGDALFCPSDGTPLQSASSVGEREPTDPYLGQEISGHIEIRQLVGVGAMGRVYRAFQKGIDRDVAVKVLHRELSANQQLVSRFTREAKVASRLQHANVVSVLLAGQLPDRALYMVMEYLDGLSLQSALAAAGGSLPLPRALHIALQLCEAAGEAHAQGIVHRDLKPENVMLVKRGADPDFVKVLDFGIARINWGEQTVATAAGLIFGTARYISPEGAQGNQVGPASDVYAIATVLYQMLSGRTPFDGNQAVGLLVQQIHDPAPPLRSIPRAADVPEPIANVIMASLAKDPAQREPDARALGQAIFDAAKLSGLSPDELARPYSKRTSSVISAAPSSGVGVTPLPDRQSGKKITQETVKWEPPTEFQARLAEVAAQSSARPRLKSGVEDTLDDDDRQSQRTPPRTIPATMPGDFEMAHFPATPTPTPTPMTVPTPSAPRVSRPPSGPQLLTPTPSHPSLHDAHAHEPDESPARRPLVLFVLGCFLLGVLIAAIYAYRSGKLGGDDEERVVTRATDALFKNHFAEPPGDNVKEITDEGLKRYPNDRKIVDVRVRAANALTTQAVAQRSAGDIPEALRLARLALELDPNDAATQRLVDQYGAEVAMISTSAAPTLMRPPPSHPPTSGSVQSAHADVQASVDVSNATPKVGQTIDLIAHVAPNRGTFADPSFVVVAPSAPAGTKIVATATAPGVFKSTYTVGEPGKIDITFTTTADGNKPVAVKRSVVAAGGGAPPPVTVIIQPPTAPTPAPTPPAPTGSVKWM